MPAAQRSSDIAPLGDRVEPFQAVRVHIADLAARGAHQVHLHAALGIQRQRAARAEGFIVRMGQNGQ